MLFWIFVIIFVVLIGVVICANVLYKQHEEKVNHAYNIWDSFTDSYNYDRNQAAILRKQYELEETKFNNWKETPTGKFTIMFSDTDTASAAIAIVLIACLSIISVGCLIGIISSNIKAPIEENRLNATREVLIYELENDIYSDFGDDVVGKKELYNQIREFNSEIAEWKAASNNFWIGIFYPDVTKNINPIPLS